MRDRITIVILALASMVGAAIGYVDSRPTWDDTGITVGAIALAAALLAALRPRLAWWVGVLVGTPVLAFDVATRGGCGSAVAVVIGLVGAGFGRECRGAGLGAACGGLVRPARNILAVGSG
jgi:hypothetical protein